MRINFVSPNYRKPRLIAEVELVFEDGDPLAGLKLVGFNLWRKPRTKNDSRDPKDLYVTYPSRAFDTGSERKYFDYLRSAREKYEDTSELRERIIDAWLKS